MGAIEMVSSTAFCGTSFGPFPLIMHVWSCCYSSPQ
jgi:hypothetical protein